MDVKEIKKLLDAMIGAEVSELTLETGEYKLMVRRGGDGTYIPAVPADSQPVQQPRPSEVPQPAPTPEAAPVATPEAAAQNKAHLAEVVAPIVGTFYWAPSPDAEPYVKVGDRVERGTVLCIIEAMKLMNEIEAETAGTIAEVLVRNEEPVEYGQVLFRIDPR